MAFVNGVVYKIISPGQTFTIFGGFFDGDCSVYFGDTKASVVDYDEDRIEVIAPIEKGAYKVTLDDGTRTIDVCNVAVVELAETPRRFAPKDYTNQDFLNYAISLLPRGNALSIWKGSNFNKLLTALADAFKYTWETIQAMVDSVDPTHTENYSEWEGELNLPVLGINPETIEGRRAEIYRAECTEGGCSKSFITKMLSLMGIEADVYEYTKDTDKFSGIVFPEGEDPRFYLLIIFHLHSEDFVQFRAGSASAGDYLIDFKQYKEEAVFDEIKQAHIKIIYGYDDGVTEGHLLTDDGKCLTDENGNRLTYNLKRW